MHHQLKLSSYVYEIANALIPPISQVEPKKLAFIVIKPKMRSALGIAVDFAGDYLRHKKMAEFNTLDKLLSEDLRLLILFPTIQIVPPESVQTGH